MPINISNNNGNISPTQNASTIIFWDWNPAPVFKLTWKTGTTIPSSTLVAAKIPAYELRSFYSSYTNFQLNVVVSSGSNPQIVKVNAANTYTGDLGTEITENQLTFYEKELSFSFSNFNLLSLGTYFIDVLYKVSAINPENGLREDIGVQSFPFEISVVNTDVAVLNYTWNLNLFNILYFSYYSGGNLPQQFPVTLYHNVPFTVTVSDPLVLFNTVANSNYTFLNVSFASGISALSVGTYNYQITLNYGSGISKIIDVSLEVLDTSNSFYVAPNVAFFEVFKNANAPAPILINTLSPSVWNVNENLPTWLKVTPNIGNGITDVYLEAVNFNDLPVGEYNFYLDFTNETETETVVVQLILNDYLTNPFKEGKLYFTEALDYLEFNSQEIEPSFVEIELNIKVFKLNLYDEINYLRHYKLPLYKGKGDFHIGTIVHQLLEEIEALNEVVPLFEGSYAKTQYVPAEVSVTFTERSYAKNAILQTGSIPLIKFLKGNKPYVTDSQLSLLSIQQQNVSRITPKSIIGLGFTHLENPLIKVIRNGQLIEEINVLVFSTLPEKIIHSYYRFNNDFVPGDSIEIKIQNNLETRIQRYIVFPEGTDSTYFLFENQNGIIEPFEFSGRVRVNSAYTHITTKVFKNLFEIDKKIDSLNKQSIIVNTGQLLPSDHKIIDAIIKSKKVWCAFNDPSGAYFLVDSTSTKMTPSDTFDYDKSYDVEFNILENANATIYPQ